MNPPHLSDASPLAWEILDYLMRHPEARDTVEGISQWWLLEQRIQRTLPEVEAALAELVEQGFVQEHRQKDGRICYLRNRERDDESRRWLSVRRRGWRRGARRGDHDLSFEN